MVLYLVALNLTFSFPLLFEQFLVCLLVVYQETMYGNHRSLLVSTHWPNTFFAGGGGGGGGGGGLVV